MTLPLAGLRVLDASTILAAPLVASLLAEFGADVIKVEQPGTGDPARSFAPSIDDSSLIWKVTNRNKRSITVNLADPDGAELFGRLSSEADVVIMNFRPSTARRWGIDFDALRAHNDQLIVFHLSAFGLTGPYADRPGFARIAEAFGGLTHITGDADGPPRFPGYPIGDGVAGMYGAFLVMIALEHRRQTGEGQLIDLGLYEPVFRMMEDLVVRYDVLGEVKGRHGNDQDHSCPNDVYPTSDGQLVVIPASTPNMWQRLCELLDDPELATLDTAAKRVADRDRVDGAVADFTRRFERDELIAMLEIRGIACGPVNTAADLANDPHIRSRGGITSVHDSELGRDIAMQAPIGKFSSVEHQPPTEAPRLGEHTDELLDELLKLAPDEITALRHRGVI